MIIMMDKELEISERFDIDDIRKTRSCNTERFAGMTPAEIVAITRVGAEKVLKYLERQAAVSQ